MKVFVAIALVMYAMFELAAAGEINMYTESTGIIKGNLIGTLPTLKKQWQVKFEFYATKWAPWGRYASVLHLTTGANCCAKGGRIPGIWTGRQPSGNTNPMLISNYISGNGDRFFNSPNIKLNEWINMKLEMKKEGTAYVYRVFNNDQQILQQTTSTPEEFNCVEVWSADPWHAPQAGYIRNLHIENLENDGTQDDYEPITDFKYDNFKDNQNNLDCKICLSEPKGCYNTKQDFVRGQVLVNWRQEIEWESDRITPFAKSMVCACTHAARAAGVKFFGMHFWGECWALEVAQIDFAGGDGDCVLADGKFKTKCDKLNHRYPKPCMAEKSYWVYQVNPLL